MTSETRLASSGLRRTAGLVALGLTTLWIVWFFYGIGPDRVPPPPEWYAPSGFIHGNLPSEFLPGLQTFVVEHTSAEDEILVENVLLCLAFSLIPGLLAGTVFWGLRSSVARTVALFSLLGTFVLGYYGMQATGVWEFFEAGWSGTMLLFSMVLSGALAAPFLARSLAARSWPIRAALYLPVALFLIAMIRNTTGTDPTLTFNISPWPAFSWFGAEIGVTIVGFLTALVALALASFSARRTHPPRAVAGIALVLSIPVAWVFLGLGPEAEMVVVGLCVGSGVLLASHAGTDGNAKAPMAAGAPVVALGSVLALMPVLLGVVAIDRDYAVSRGVHAGVIMNALESFYAREELYPDELDELVVAGDLKEVPGPRIGFPLAGNEDEFTYQSLGSSYLLEFSAARWVQCAYSSPWADEEEYEDEEEDEEEDLAGSWSCPSKPPELW